MTMSSPLNITHNRKRKTVRFAVEASQTTFITSFREFSTDERGNVWYSRDELKRNDSQNKSLQRLIKSGRFELDSEGYSIRGIFTEETKAKRAEHIEQARTALFSEQQRQHMAGITNEKKIRNVLIECTKPTMDEAIARAQQDQRAILNCLSTTTKDIDTGTTASKGGYASAVQTLQSALAYKASNANILPPSIGAPFGNNNNHNHTSSDLMSMLDDALAIVHE